MLLCCCRLLGLFFFCFALFRRLIIHVFVCVCWSLSCIIFVFSLQRRCCNGHDWRGVHALISKLLTVRCAFLRSKLRSVTVGFASTHSNRMPYGPTFAGSRKRCSGLNPLPARPMPGDVFLNTTLRMCILAVCLRALSTVVSVAIR